MDATTTTSTTLPFIDRPMSPPPSAKRGAAYLSISRACSLCKRDHKACNGARPCSRCVSAGMGDKCEDVVLKTRGRPRKKRLVASSGLESSFDGIPAYPASSSSTSSADAYTNNVSFYISSFPSPSVEILSCTKEGRKESGTTTATQQQQPWQVGSQEQLAQKFKRLQDKLQQQRQQPQQQQQQGQHIFHSTTQRFHTTFSSYTPQQSQEQVQQQPQHNSKEARLSNQRSNTYPTPAYINTTQHNTTTFSPLHPLSHSARRNTFESVRLPCIKDEMIKKENDEREDKKGNNNSCSSSGLWMACSSSSSCSSVPFSPSSSPCIPPSCSLLSEVEQKNENSPPTLRKTSIAFLCN